MDVLGVITKPDALPSGSTTSRELWLDVLEGRRHPLKHGYYCTRQPDDEERMHGISLSDARAKEVAFFDSPPWTNSTHRYRFGTKNLVESLSKLLSTIIDERFVRHSIFLQRL